MASGKRYRWACPDPEHPGILAPARMRKADVRRFCWPCSQEAGVLVERTASALEEKRERQQAASQRRAATRRKKEAQRRARQKAHQKAHQAAVKRWQERVDAKRKRVGLESVDVRAEVARVWPTVCALSDRQDLDPAAPPPVQINQRGGSTTTGTAHLKELRIQISVAKSDDAAGIYGTIAHELVHLGAPAAGHRRPFWDLLVRVCAAAYDADTSLEEVTQERGPYQRQHVVEHGIRMARERAGL